MKELGADVKTPYPRLRYLAEHGDRKEKYWAIRLLSTLEFRQAAKLVGKVLEEAIQQKGTDRWPNISTCCMALGRFDTDISHEILVNHFRNGSEVAVRGQALESFGYEKKHSSPKLIIDAARTEPDREMRKCAMWAVFEQGKLDIYKPYERIVIERMSDIAPEVRALAFNIIGHWGRPRDLEVLSSHFDDSANSPMFHKSIGEVAREAHEEIARRFREEPETTS